ncbi:MAG: glutaminyl-peptide cyclotransferase [Chloroflexota bacterium]
MKRPLISAFTLFSAIIFTACSPTQLPEIEEEEVEVAPELSSATETPLALATAAPLPTQPPTPNGYPQPIIETGYPEPSEPILLTEEGYPAPTEATEQVTTLLELEVIEAFPHNTAVFTQGLVWDNGIFYESGGNYGESAVYQVEPQTGQPILSSPIAPEFFAEGLALVDNRLIMLTWKEGVAIEFDKNSLQEVGRFTYEGQGWGLCYEPIQNQLWMSSGSSLLVSRNPITFEITGQVEVTDNGQAVTQINELECVNGLIYANIWKSDVIVVIDSQSGAVVQKIDGSTLLTAEERAELQPGRQVLNGIAYNPQEDVFYLTGKEWPKLFKVRIVSNN